jgi:GNAT superfamily N-acetyltransferase
MTNRYDPAMPHLELQGANPSADLLTVVEETPPPEFVALCWNVFFASRHRGISMRVHFPWLGLPDTGFFTILRCGLEIVAGCAVRFIQGGPQQPRVAAIGLVCVDDRYRGLGYSTQVLERAIAHARHLGLSDLVLWTSKPGVYERYGFRTRDASVYGQVSMNVNASWALKTPPASSNDWPDGAETRGLPPFASRGTHWRTSNASAIVLNDAAGSILAEWAGAEDVVADLLEQAMPPTWRINAFEDDPLLKVLNRRGHAMQLKPSNLQMILELDAQGGDRPAYALRVLDRI